MEDSEQERQTQLVIRRARNGYVVDPYAEESHLAKPTPYVFESFRSLVSWMAKNLEGGEE